MAVRSVTFSRKADFAVSGSASGQVCVLDLPSFAVRETFEHGHEVNCVAIAPRSGALVLSAGDDGRCKAWALGGGLVSSFVASEDGLVYSCAIAEDETRCLVCTWGGEVAVLGFPNGVRLALLQSHQSVVMSVACDLAFSRAMSASWDGTCRVWDLTRLELERELDGHGSQDCNAVAICERTGKLGASASNDRTVAVWDLDSGAMLRRLAGHSDIVVGVALRVGWAGRFAVLSAAWDGTVRLFDSEAEEGAAAVVAKHPPKAACVAFSPSGSWFASGGFDGKLAWGDLCTQDRERVVALAASSVLPIDLVRIVRALLF